MKESDIKRKAEKILAHTTNECFHQIKTVENNGTQLLDSVDILLERITALPFCRNLPIYLEEISADKHYLERVTRSLNAHMHFLTTLIQNTWEEKDHDV